MKRTALLMLLIFTASSFAFSAGMFGFGAHGNFATLNVPEPLKAAYGAGFGGGLHLDLRFGIATIRVNGDYITFAADQDVFRDLIFNEAVKQNPAIVKTAIGVDGGRTSILSFGLNGKFGLPRQAVSPYAIVGLGSATLKTGELNVSYNGAPISKVPDSPSLTKLMVNAGAGVDFTLGTVALFVEAKYTWIFTEEKSTYFPVTVGLTF